VIERPLSTMGTTARFVARGPDGDRVVVELFEPDTGTGAARARLVREIRALSSIDHRNLARVRSSGEQDGRIYYATEYVQGTDLARVLAERGTPSVDAAYGYVAQAADALAAAHGAGIVHRDMTPAKLRLARDGRFVVVGFGLGTHRPDRRDAADGPVATAATPYVAPEQIEHDMADERSDVWALGCVLYELLAGFPPFGRGGVDTTEAILRDEPPWSERVTGPVVHVISACLRKSSFARVGSMRELLGLLRDASEGPHPPAASGELPRSSSRRPSAGPSARPSAPPPAPAHTRRSSPPRTPSAPRFAPIAARLGSRPPARPATFPPSAPMTIAPPIPPSIVPSFPPSVPPSLPPTSWAPSASRAPTALGRIKGTALRAGLAWYAGAYGPSVLARIGTMASPELHATLRLQDPEFGIMPSGWYDAAVAGELLDLLDRAATPSDSEIFLSKLAQAIAADNVSGVYKSLFRLVSSPAMLEAHAQRVWRTYIDEGNLSVRITGRGSFEAHVTGWSRHNATVCRFLRPLTEQILRAVGYTALVVERTACIEDGETSCAFDGIWVPG
jgi:serine/threonine protein kinase